MTHRRLPVAETGEVHHDPREVRTRTGQSPTTKAARKVPLRCRAKGKLCEQFSAHQIKDLRVAYLCCIIRHEEQNGPCILKGPRDIAHAASTHTGALSSRSRGCLLPAMFCVRRIPYRAMTGATHGTPLPPLGRRDPARILARDNVAWGGELHVVTAVACTAQRHRLGLPDLIMPVGLPH